MTEAPIRRPTSDRVLDGVEAVLWLVLVAFGLAVAFQVLQGAEEERTPPTRGSGTVPDLVEAEALTVLAKSRDFTFWLQPTTGFAERWSGDAHLFAFGTREGDWIDLALPETEPGAYDLELFFTQAADYGILRAAVNGAPAGDPIDLWAPAVSPTGPVDLGEVELRGSGDVLRLTVVGANPAAAPPFFQFGIDGVRLSSSP